jgi:EpsI family protein
MTHRCLVLIALLTVAFAARARLDAPQKTTGAEPLVQFPVALGHWMGHESPLDPEVVRVAAVSDHLNRYYRSSAGEVGLYVGYYRSQQQGESLHSPLFCLPGSGWQPIMRDRVDLHTDGAESGMVVNRLVAERGLNRLLVLYWYQTFSRVTASEYGRKLFLMRDAFISGRTDVALVRIVAPIGGRDTTSEATSFSVARPFAELVLSEVQQRLFRE